MTDLKNKVVVITGASSGIGRATALLAARQGATVILVSRQGEELRKVAAECEKAGGRAIAAPADVTDADALHKIAKSACRQFGQLDAWVNNAAVTLFAKFEVAPPDEYRRVIETNLYGYINGARAALPFFHEQGGGILINVSSVVGRIGSPYVSAYTASKFAINGWSESLRMEFVDQPEIHVCTILAASIDTPLFQHAANYTGRAVKPLPPVYSAETVAEAIVGCIHRPRPEIYAGKMGGVLTGARVLMPGRAEKMMAHQVEKEHFQEAPAHSTEGNLFSPMADRNAVSGGWRESEPSADGKKTMLTWAAAIAGAGAVATGFFLARKTRPIQETKRRLDERSRKLMGEAGEAADEESVPTDDLENIWRNPMP